MNDSVKAYDCIGICQPDPLSGQCTGCGRPLTPAPATARSLPSSTPGHAPQSSLANRTPAKISGNDKAGGQP